MYRGRFAPSPTGPLHFGSLLTATASYLEARSRQGEWLLRMEDIDPPREPHGAAADILHSLERFGFAWDGPVLYQSRRHDAYLAAQQQLQQSGKVYACHCSRQDVLMAGAAAGLAPGVYPATCRHAGHDLQTPAILRVDSRGMPIRFTDWLQGPQQQHVEREIGDFAIRRADGLWTYQLAVVVDDAAQGITHVVRGCDLLSSTARQIHLQRLLGLPTPDYLHLPIAINQYGEKLSKQTFARPLADDLPVPQLWQALELLGQQPPSGLQHGKLAELWEWAMQHWRTAAIPAQRAVRHV